MTLGPTRRGHVVLVLRSSTSAPAGCDAAPCAGSRPAAADGAPGGAEPPAAEGPMARRVQRGAGQQPAQVATEARRVTTSPFYGLTRPICPVRGPAHQGLSVGLSGQSSANIIRLMQGHLQPRAPCWQPTRSWRSGSSRSGCRSASTACAAKSRCRVPSDICLM